MKAGGLLLFRAFAACGGDPPRDFLMVLIAGIRFGVLAAFDCHAGHIFRATDVVQTQDIGQLQRLRVRLGEPFLKPHRRSVAHAVAVVAFVEIIRVADFKARCGHDVPFVVVAFFRPNDVVVHLRDLMVDLVLRDIADGMVFRRVELRQHFAARIDDTGLRRRPIAPKAMREMCAEPIPFKGVADHGFDAAVDRQMSHTAPSKLAMDDPVLISFPLALPKAFPIKDHRHEIMGRRPDQIADRVVFVQHQKFIDVADQRPIRLRRERVVHDPSQSRFLRCLPFAGLVRGVL